MSNSAIDSEFVIFSIPGMLGYSKSRKYQEQTLAIFNTLVRFLQTNGLVMRELIDKNGEVPRDLEVKRKDFTDEGFEFYCLAEQKWMKAIDRGGSPTDTTILESTLKKVRQAT